MTHPVDLHVGHNLRQRRWMAGMTQQELGKRVGTKAQQIQKYEGGVNRVSASRLWDIAEVLDVPIDTFFEGLEGGVDECEDASSSVLSDKEAAALIRAFYSIPESRRSKLLDLAQILTDVA